MLFMLSNFYIHLVLWVGKALIVFVIIKVKVILISMIINNYLQVQVERTTDVAELAFKWSRVTKIL